MQISFENYEQIKSLIKNALSKQFLNAYNKKLIQIRINGKSSHWLQQDKEGKLYPYEKDKRKAYNANTASFASREQIITHPWLARAPKIQGQQVNTTQNDRHNDHIILGIRFNPLYYHTINLGDVINVVPLLSLRLDDCLYLDNDSLTYSIMPQLLEKLKTYTTLEQESAISIFAQEVLDLLINNKSHTFEKENKLIYRFNIKDLTVL